MSNLGPPDEITMKWDCGVTLVLGKHDIPDQIRTIARSAGLDPAIAASEAARTFAYLAHCARPSVGASEGSGT